MQYLTISENDSIKEATYTTIKKINGENYENFFFTTKEIRLQKLKKLTTEEKL